MHRRVADGVGEAIQGAEVIADMAPGMMRTVRDRHGARPVIVLHALDFAGDDVERFVPADPHVFRFAAVLRIALAFRIEIDPLHRVEQAIGRIDHRLAVLPMRSERRLARRRQFHAARLDRPGLRIGFVKIDRCGANDLSVLDINEKRAAVRHVAIAHRAVRHRRAEFPVRGLHHHQGLREPVGQVLRTVDAEHKILLRVDLIEPVDRRRQQRRADRGILEGERDIGLRMLAGARSDLPSRISIQRPVPSSRAVICATRLRSLRRAANSGCRQRTKRRNCATANRMSANFACENIVRFLSLIDAQRPPLARRSAGAAAIRRRL